MLMASLIKKAAKSQSQQGELSIMKRRDFVKVTGLAAAAATIAAPAIAQSMPELKWRMTASWPKSLDTLYGGAEIMAKAVAEATDNKFRIQTFGMLSLNRAGGLLRPAPSPMCVRSEPPLVAVPISPIARGTLVLEQ